MATTTSTVERPQASERSGLPGWVLWPLRALMGFVLVGMIAVFIRESLSDPWMPVWTAVMVGIGVLGVIYPSVVPMFERALTQYFMFCFWMFVCFSPATLAIWIARKIEQQSSLSVQIAAFVIWACLLGCATLFLATEERRKRLFEFLKPAGALAPVAYAANVLLLALPLFGSLTRVLLARGAIHLTGDPQRAMDFYLWHFLSDVPLLKINETLLWEQPLVYHEARVGWLLLVFKLLVIIPVIAAFRGYWKYTHTKSTPQEVEWHS
jgi:hypothetical protein